MQNVIPNAYQHKIYNNMLGMKTQRSQNKGRYMYKNTCS